VKELAPENLLVFLWEPIIFIFKTMKNNFLRNKIWILEDNIKIALKDTSCEVGQWMGLAQGYVQWEV
jgi:hypothetical protein